MLLHPTPFSGRSFDLCPSTAAIDGGAGGAAGKLGANKNEMRQTKKGGKRKIHKKRRVSTGKSVVGAKVKSSRVPFQEPILGDQILNARRSISVNRQEI